MRRFLARVYLASGLLAGLFLVLLGLLVVAQIIARQFGTMIPSTDEFAGYCMAAATFLALPYAFFHGDHIRVLLVVKQVPPHARRHVELVSTLIGLVLVLFLAWNVALFVHETWTLKEVSSGLLPIPMWWPQMAMLIGVVLLAVAFVERAVAAARGRVDEEGGKALTE